MILISKVKPPVGLRFWGTRLAGISAESEIKTGALAGLGPDLTPVALDDALHGGQTDTTAFKFIGRVQAVERLEKLAGILTVKACTIVLNKEDRLTSMIRSSLMSPWAETSA